MRTISEIGPFIFSKKRNKEKYRSTACILLENVPKHQLFSGLAAEGLQTVLRTYVRTVCGRLRRYVSSSHSGGFT